MKIKLFTVYCILIFTTGCQTGKIPQSKSYSDIDKSFFPVYGIILGKTTIDEIRQLGHKCKEFQSEEELKNGYCNVETLTFWDHDNDLIVESIYITDGEKIPDKWIQNFGFCWRLSYNEWIKLFEKLGYIIDITKDPATEVYSERNTLSAKFTATSLTHKLSFRLNFNYGNEDNDGYSVDSPFSLYSITVDFLPTIP